MVGTCTFIEPLGSRLPTVAVASGCRSRADEPLGYHGSCLRFIGSSASRPSRCIPAPCLLTSGGPAQNTLKGCPTQRSGRSLGLQVPFFNAALILTAMGTGGAHCFSQIHWCSDLEKC